MRKPSSRILTNTADVWSIAVAVDSSLAPVFVPSGPPTYPSVRCSVQYVETAVDESTFGKLTTVNLYIVFFGFNPRLKPRDLLVWRDPTPSRNLYVQANPPSEAGRAGAWAVRFVEQI